MKHERLYVLIFDDVTFVIQVCKNVTICVVEMVENVN